MSTPFSSESANHSAAYIPLPPSRDEEHELETLNSRIDGSQSTSSQFVQNIEELSKWLPHLKVLASDPKIPPSYRRWFPPDFPDNYAQITIRDCYLDGRPSVSQTINSDTMGAKEICSKVTPPMFEEKLNRIIMVEDLSPAVIEGLSSAFSITLEMFAEHLNKSLYGSSTYEDPEPSAWNFRSEKKSYVSLRWFRPIYRTGAVPLNSCRNPRHIEYGPICHECKGESGYDSDYFYYHSIRRRTNILRQQRPFSAIPEPPEPPVTSAPASILASLEERVTVCRTKVDGKCCGI